MISKALFHYILAFTVLFASSFAVFHGSEHIAIGKIDSAKASFTADNANHFHYESEHHDHDEPSSPTKNHSLELLCEACLILSNLTAYSLGYTHLSASAERSKHRTFKLVHSKNQPFQTYLSRAPPSNA